MPRPRAFDEQQVLAKAMDTFWRQGYHATSIQDLVEALGINRASLYATFGGKHQLFKRTLEHYRTINQESVAAFLEGEPSGKTAIVKLFRQAVTEVHTDREGRGCFIVNVTTELAQSDLEVNRFLVLNQEGVVALFRRALQRAQIGGEIAADRDTQALALYLFALYNGIKVLHKLHPEPEALARAINEAMRGL